MESTKESIVCVVMENVWWGWVADQRQPSKESCEELLMLALKARCSCVQVMRLQRYLPTVSWCCRLVACSLRFWAYHLANECS